MSINNYRKTYSKINQNQFSPNNMYNPINNDYDLQKRIDKSLYPYNYLRKKQKFESLPTINNISDYNYNSSNNDLIEEFKNTLRRTQQLQNQLMNKDTFYKGNYNYNNKYKYNSNFNSDSKKYSEEFDSDDNNIEESEENDDEEEEEEENSLNDEKEININNNINKFKLRNNNNENILIQNKGGEEKLKLSNQLLKNSNQDLRNENRILEVEITNYKSHENSKKKSMTNFDENLLNFITSTKQSLKDITKKNTEIVDQIFEHQKNIEDMITQNKKLSEQQKKLAEKIEINNRKKAETQIMNEENEKKINNLEEEKNILNEKIEKLKIDLNNLKGAENNLKILNDSNLKKKQDNKELITNLNKTINQLNLEIASSKEKFKINNKKNKTAANYLNIYEQNILSMNNKIKSMEFEKGQYLQENANLNVEMKTNKNVNNDEGKEIEKKLKEELNKLKLENERLKNKLGEKEKKVQNLKEYTNKVPEITKKGNFEEEIKQFNLEGILTESDVDLNDNNIENKEEKKIRNEIKSALNKNESKQNEIDETKKYYNNLMIQKDGIINALESQIKPSLQKDNNYMNKGNINNNINNKEINSIKELNLDYENMLQNNNPNIQPQEQENYEDNMDNNDYENVNEEEMEEFQYNPEGEEQYGNDEIHDLGDIGENEGEEGYEEYQNPNYEYNPQYQNEEDDNEYNEGQMNEEFEEEGEEGQDAEYYGDMGNMDYGNGEQEDFNNFNNDINDLEINQENKDYF